MEDNADYAGRLLADRYRLPQLPAEEYELAETRAYDTASGQEVLVRQVPLPEVVDAEMVDGGQPSGGARPLPGAGSGRATRRPAEPGVRRAVEAALAASRIPDHPRLDQVFDVFVEGDGLWIVSELVPARPLVAVLAEQPLSPHRAAEIAADLLDALNAVHTHGWVHRNITARSVLVCDDGRALLTGMAVGAAEEALCGYDTLPDRVAGPADPVDHADPAAPADGPSRGAHALPAVPAEGAGSGANGARGANGAGARGTYGQQAPYGQRDPYGQPDPYGQSGQRRDGRYAWGEGAYEPRGGAGAQRGGPNGPGPGPGLTGGAGPGPGAGAGAGGAGGSAPPPERLPRGPLPEGFSGRYAGPEAPGQEPGGGQPPHAGDTFGRGGSAGAPPAGAPGSGGAGVPGAYAGPGAGDAQRAGIFGFEGADSGGGAAARAARRGAIAAYRAGARAASARVEAEAQGRTAAQQPALPEGGTTSADWWTPGGDGAPGAPERQEPLVYGPEGQPYGPEPHTVAPSAAAAPNAPSAPYEPEERTERWSGEGPTALPGARHGTSRSVPVPRYPREPQPEPPYEPEAYQPDPYQDPYQDRGQGPDRDNELHEDHAYDPAHPPYQGSPDRYRGPVTALDAERARQARMTVVGAVTERWAPEQAGPVYENWRLAPPVGPAADLWALGVLLFRAVQGHAPYPEDSVAELVQMVCAEPPAYAEECGALRPVVESLLRQDPTERPEFEELRGWLRSLIRSAPEPEVGRRTLTAPPSLEPGRPSDPKRLPIKRRRGELVRRRRMRKQPAPPQKQPKQRRGHRPADEPAAAPQVELPAEPRPERPARRPRREPRARAPRGADSPRRLGRLLLGLVLLVLTLAVLYAMWFMPEQDSGGSDGRQRGSVGEQEPAPSGAPEDGEGGDEGKAGDGRDAPEEQSPQTTQPADLAKGFSLHKDATGFQIGLPDGWDRSGPNDRGQVRFDSGEFEMVVVKGRDTTAKYGKDPLEYQADSERELAPFRDSGWSSASSLRRIDVGDTAMAEGTYTWEDDSGRKVYVRNRAMILGDRYHLVLLIGPEDEKQDVDRYFEGVVDTYRVLS